MLKRRHKRGASFRVGLVLLEDDGETPVDLTGKTVTSHIRLARDSDASPVDELVVTVIDASAGSVEITRGATDTALWPIGVLQWDTRVVDDVDADEVDISETIELTIDSEVTRS